MYIGVTLMESVTEPFLNKTVHQVNVHGDENIHSWENQQYTTDASQANNFYDSVLPTNG